MQEDVRSTLTRLNRAWLDSRFDELPMFFDEQVVMKGPAMQELPRGRDAVVAGYVEFMQKSKVTEYEETGHVIDVWGDTAVATYDWTIGYEQAGKTSRDSGHDMFVFVRRDSRWVAVLRLMLF